MNITKSATISDIIERISLEELDDARAAIRLLPECDARQTLLKLVRGAEVYINIHRTEQLRLF